MTPLQAVTIALYGTAAVSAVVLARRDPRHQPVAWYLCAVVAIDALRWLRAALLPAATGPREGWELVARHLEQGLYLAAILALPALAVVLWLRRPPWPVAAAWAGLWLWLAGEYPELSGAGLMRVYGLVEVGAVLVSAACLVSWLRSPALLTDGPTPAVRCGLALLAGASATCALPRLTGGTVLEQWPVVVAVNAVMVAAVLGVQLRQLVAAPEGAPS